MTNPHNNPELNPTDGKHKQPPALDEREQKLRKLKQRIKDGTYKVDADAVAEKIVRKHFLSDDKDRH